LIGEAYVNALEIIPRALSNKGGFDSFETLNKLRSVHATNLDRWWGVDIETGGIINTMEAFVWEPLVVKQNSLNVATEAP
jgi:T-complex protein 1 subunit eta